MKVAVVNSSPTAYNLASHRIANYHRALGDQVEVIDGTGLFLPEVWESEKFYFSCIFTWDLPAMVDAVSLVLDRGATVEVGGPAATALPGYIKEQTGVEPFVGLDSRFEHVGGDDYRAVFTSRGCPRACGFCIVQEMEGRKMIEYEDYPIPVGKNPYVCDNNVLLTSWKHQVRMVERLKQVRNLDLNSGFDDRIFIRDPEKYYQLYSQLHLEAWRFAYDSPEQKEPIKACAEFLHGKGIDHRRIIVFCLVGYNTSLEESRERLQYLVDLEVSPYPMRYRPLDSVSKTYTPPGWEKGDMDFLFGYYGVPWKWRSVRWEEYKGNYKPGTSQDQIPFRTWQAQLQDMYGPPPPGMTVV